MKLLIILVAIGLANGQGGFFSNVRNALFGARPQRPPPQAQQPPQQFGQQPPPQQFGQQPPPQQAFPPQQAPLPNQPVPFQQQGPRPVPPNPNVPAGNTILSFKYIE